MQIIDGYAIMGYDYDVKKSDQKCLFNMKETMKEKQLREAKIELGKQSLGFNAKTLGKVTQMLNIFTDQVAKVKATTTRPEINLGEVMKTLNAKRDDLFEGLKNVNGPELLKMMKDSEKQFKDMNAKV